MTNYSEQVVVFNCGADRLVGITATPELAADVGVLILVGGPQYRVGSHRQFTLLARSLAEAGVASMRFDYRGMGDSEGKKSEFDETEEDISAAIDALIENTPGVSRVVLWGLCDAASSALIFAHRHPTVTGLMLLNPWVHSGDYSPQVKLAHYYGPSLSKRHQWRRLLSGQIRLIPAFMELAKDSLALFGKNSQRTDRESSSRSFVQVMLEGLEQFQHGILIVLSEADLTAREFSTLIAQDEAWKTATSKPAVSINTLTGADHTFSQKPWQEEVSRLTIEWVKQQ
jgi:exosortase A-associated hydrolase 1